MRRYLVDLRSILLAFAIFDFITIWMMASKIRFACTVPPAYHPWNYLLGPTILLVAALFLCANRWWGNTIALLVSSSFIGYFVYILLIGDPVMSLPNTWTIHGIYYPDLVLVQYVFALIVLGYSALSLRRKLVTASAD